MRASKKGKGGTSKDAARKVSTEQSVAPKLTARQETFAQGVASGLSQSDAFRKAYPTCLKWPAKTIHEKASTLAANGKVVERVAELRKPVIDRVQYLLKDAMLEAEEARQLALKDEKGAAAAVSATSLKARLNGMFEKDNAQRGDAAIAALMAAVGANGAKFDVKA